MEITIKSPETEQEWKEYYDLRYRILREPLNQPRGSERNEGDETAKHFALYKKGELVAVARMDEYSEESAQARFVAVKTEEQGKGFGKMIMREIEKKATAKKYLKLILHARHEAVEFYEKIGYEYVGPTYKLFDVLQHFLMVKFLQK